jgi:hypothetical protein
MSWTKDRTGLMVKRWLEGGGGRLSDSSRHRVCLQTKRRWLLERRAIRRERKVANRLSRAMHSALGKLFTAPLSTTQDRARAIGVVPRQGESTNELRLRMAAKILGWSDETLAETVGELRTQTERTDKLAREGFLSTPNEAIVLHTGARGGKTARAELSPPMAYDSLTARSLDGAGAPTPIVEPWSNTPEPSAAVSIADPTGELRAKLIEPSPENVPRPIDYPASWDRAKITFAVGPGALDRSSRSR